MSGNVENLGQSHGVLNPTALENEGIHDHEFVIQGKTIPVNKRAISSRSAYFKAFFDGPTEVITWRHTVITDCDYNTFKELIDYLTTGVFPDLSRPVRFLKLADRYRVPALYEKCEEIIRETLTEYNALNYLVSAVRLMKHHLVNHIVDFITEHFDEIINQAAWDYLAQRFEEMMEILKAFWRRKVSKGMTFPQGFPNLQNASPYVGELIWTPLKVTWRVHLNFRANFITAAPSFSPSFFVGDLDVLSIHEFRFIWLPYDSVHYVLVATSLIDSNEFDLYGTFDLEGGQIIRNISYSSELKLICRRHLIGPYRQINPTLGWICYSGGESSRLNIEFSYTVENPTNTAGRCIIMAQFDLEAPRRLYEILPPRFGPHEGECPILVRNEAFFCRRSVCAAKSEFLANVFSTGSAAYVWAPDNLTPNDFAVVVKYLHTDSGELPLPSDVNLMVLVLAKTLKLDELFSFCDQTLAQRVHPRTAIEFYKLGHNLGAPRLKSCAKNCVIFCMNQILPASWECLRDHPELLLELLESLN